MRWEEERGERKKNVVLLKQSKERFYTLRFSFISLLTSFPSYFFPFPSSDVRRAREPTRRECRRGAAVLERLDAAAVVRERRRAAAAPLRRSHLPRARALAADMLHLAAAGVSDRSSSFQVKHPPYAQTTETLLFVFKDARPGGRRVRQVVRSRAPRALELRSRGRCIRRLPRAHVASASGHHALRGRRIEGGKR